MARQPVSITAFKIIKSGTGAKGLWTLYEVEGTKEDGSPIKFKDFGSKYAWENMVGQTINEDFEEKVNGQFKDLFIKRVGFAKQTQSADLSEVLTILKRLETKFDMFAKGVVNRDDPEF